MVVLRHSRLFFGIMDTLSIALSSCHIIHYFQNIGSEHMFQPIRKESINMSAVDKLVSYILKLTPEQAEKLVCHLPELVTSLGEPANEKEEYISAITMAIYKTNDIALLDLILKLLQKSRNA